jgi:hypothetical protein
MFIILGKYRTKLHSGGGDLLFPAKSVWLLSTFYLMLTYILFIEHQVIVVKPVTKNKQAR